MKKIFRKNYFMICRIKLKEKGRRFVIPLPLFIVDGILEGFWMFKPLLKKINIEKLDEDFADFNIPVKEIGKLWSCIRSCGRLELADIETDEVIVKVTLR